MATERNALTVDGRARPSAVIAHRDVWFAEKVALILASRGVAVVACTGSGVDALDVVAAEQPDLVLAGDHLAMMTGAALLAETLRVAPATLRTMHVAGPKQAAALRDSLDAVFLRYQPPGDVADALVTLVTSRLGAPATAEAGRGDAAGGRAAHPS